MAKQSSQAAVVEDLKRLCSWQKRDPGGYELLELLSSKSSSCVDIWGISVNSWNGYVSNTTCSDTQAWVIKYAWWILFQRSRDLVTVLRRFFRLQCHVITTSADVLCFREGKRTPRTNIHRFQPISIEMRREIRPLLQERQDAFFSWSTFKSKELISPLFHWLVLETVCENSTAGSLHLKNTLS